MFKQWVKGWRWNLLHPRMETARSIVYSWSAFILKFAYFNVLELDYE